MLDASGLCFSRDVVPSRAFHRHAYDLMGSREQYARKYANIFYSPLCMAMPIKPEKSYSIFSCLYGILSGLSMFCAILIKGPVGLFPLAVPLISTIHEAKKTIKAFTIFIILIMTLTISFGLMFSTNAASVHFFKRYISQQVLASVTGERETSTSRFDVLIVVGREHLVPLLVGGMLAATIYRLRQVTISSINYRLFLCYLGMALAGSLPILLSYAKQKRWYAFPSFPFYAMAIAVVFNEIVARGLGFVNNLYLTIFYFICGPYYYGALISNIVAFIGMSCLWLLSSYILIRLSKTIPKFSTALIILTSY